MNASLPQTAPAMTSAAPLMNLVILCTTMSAPSTAMIAICELYAMTDDSRLRMPAQRSVDYAVKIQDSLGGWRYQPGSDSDTSVTGWFVMGLQSARMAGLELSMTSSSV